MMSELLLGKIKDNTDNLEFSSDEQCKLTKKLIRRVESLNHQMELHNNILISIARSESKEDLNNRLDMLLCMDEV